MIRPLTVFGIILCVCPMRGDELPSLQDRPSRYDVLFESTSESEVLPFVTEWTLARRDTVSEVSEPIRSLGQRFGLRDLTADAVLAKTLRGGHEAEVALCLDRPKDIATVALHGDSDQRKQFANEMWYIEVVDSWLKKRLDPSRRESLVIVSHWASSRAAFAQDFAAKRTAIRNRGKCRIIADTVDEASRLPAPGYEVMFVLELWEDYPQQHQSFPKFSTPTNNEISPGLYVFYCRRKGDNDQYSEGPRRRLYITGDTPIDLLTPKP